MTDTVVILPTYNEAHNLKKLLPQLKQYDVDILVVDDSPALETATVARDMGIEVLRRDGKTGRVSALLEGVAATQHSNIITMDADLQHPVEVLPDILTALVSNDVVVASRRVADGGYAHFPFKRRVISYTANLLALPLAPRLKDRTSGFIAFRRCVLNGNKMPQGFSTLTITIFVAGDYKTFVEVPYIFQERLHGISKLNLAIVLSHLKQLGGLYLYKIKRGAR